MRKQRGGMAVDAEAHQHEVEKRAFGIEPIRPVKTLELGFITTRRCVRADHVCRNRMNVAGWGLNAVEEDAPRHPHVA